MISGAFWEECASSQEQWGKCSFSGALLKGRARNGTDTSRARNKAVMAEYGADSQTSGDTALCVLLHFGHQDNQK